MSAWQTLTDSDAFRRFAKQGAGRIVFRSSAFETLQAARDRARTALAVRRVPDRFTDVRTACFFVGHNKSGTSMLGGLLDAHPDVICSDEVDLLGYVERGFEREQLFHLALRGAEADARKGRVTARRLTPYSYAVPGQAQGRAERPVVVGDSTSGSSTRRLGTRPELWDRLRETMGGVDVRLIQVIRNPFDPISVMMVRGRRTFENSIEHYFTACERLRSIRERAAGSLLPVRYESFVTAPATQLERVCSFLGVTAPTGYVDACSSIVHERPDRSRDMVAWTPEWIRVVERRLADFDFLEGYSYG